MNGMDPPTPMSTGAVPHASANAAARRAHRRRVARREERLAGLAGAPGDLRAERRVRRDVRAERLVGRRGSWPGARRSEIFAAQLGASVFDASATEVTSMPITDSAGLVHSRPADVPVPGECRRRRAAEESARSGGLVVVDLAARGR